MTKFHFTIGPVQGFVAQARRTRDFWSGSFLLSYLAGQAMQAVKTNNGRIIFPVVDDDPDGANLLQAIVGNKSDSFEGFPRLGSIPNRFMAEVPDDFEPQVCIDAVNRAWQGIAEQIWERYVGPVELYGNDTRAIWQRQVESFWDISWAIGDDLNLPDRLKNWRHHRLTEEPGDKCTLMGNLQELSGYLRQSDKDNQDRFWDKLGQNMGGLDLGSDRICAIALIKRLFPRIFGQGMEHFPSTSYLAALPWLSSVVNDTDKRPLALKFAQEARKQLKGREDSSLFPVFKDVDPELREFLSLDGTCFFKSTLTNDQLWKTGTRECRDRLIELLDKFKSKPAPFYALLLMDGDHLGQLLSENDNAVVSGALGKFSPQVDNIVKKHQGLTVYAGGDDVLALLPLDQALKAAVTLKDFYQKNFNDKGIKATISAAIIYAHHHAPLKQVIARAHQILDDEAKEKSGRDALAVTVWKTGGAIINWTAPWRVGMFPAKATTMAHEYNEEVADTVAVDQVIASLIKTLQEKGLTNSWIYNMRKLFHGSKQGYTEVAKGLQPLQIMTAELMDSRDLKLQHADAEMTARQLLTLCTRQYHQRDVDDGNRIKLVRNNRQLNFDAAMVVKFLATKGAER